MIHELAMASPLPWYIISDFNDIVFINANKGERGHPRALLDGFSETVLDYGSVDLGFTGEKFTWEKARRTDRWM